MLPVIFQVIFDTPFKLDMLYLVAVLLVLYGAWSGYKGAEKPEDAPSRALGYGVASAVAAYFGVQYATANGAPLHTYGLMMATGFSLAVWLCGREAQRAYPGLKTLSDGTVIPMAEYMKEVVMDVAFYALVAGLAGARILFIIVNWDEYSKNPASIFSLSGGLVFYGAFIGGAGVVVWYMRRHKFEFLRFADIAIPSVSIAHAIGRLGCLSAGCCWGGFAPPGSKFALLFPSASLAPFGVPSLAFSSQADDHRLLSEATHKVLTQYKPDLDQFGHFAHTWTDTVTGAVLTAVPNGAIEIATEVQKLAHTLPVYPTQLMESVGETLIFLVLVMIRRSKSFHGQVLATWLMLYSVLRSSVEMLRGDEERGRIFGWLHSVPRSAWYNISTSQFVSVAIFTAGVVLWARYGRGQQALTVAPVAA